MNTKLLAGLVFAGLVMGGCGEKPAPQADKSNALQSQATDMAGKVQSKANEEKAAAEKQAQEMAKQAEVTAQQAAQQVQAKAQQAVEETKKKAQDLLITAKQYMDQGKFEQAVNAAQEVLKLDVNNVDAKKIIETAQAKIKEMAQQSMGDLKSGLSNTLGNLGK